MSDGAAKGAGGVGVDLSPLPAAYRAAFVEQQEVNDALRARVDSLTESNRRLEHLVSELRRFIYGKKSEKLDVDERELALEDLEGAVTAVAAAAPAPRAPSASAPQRNLGHLPEHLPRIERTIEPDSTQCACGHGSMVRISEDRSERLDIVPAQLRVLVTVRPKYACRACEEGVVQAPAPAERGRGLGRMASYRWSKLVPGVFRAERANLDLAGRSLQSEVDAVREPVVVDQLSVIHA